MAYTLPQFNIAVDIWVAGNNPTLGGPDIAGEHCQMYYGFHNMGTSFNTQTVPGDTFCPMTEFRFHYGLWSNLGVPLIGGVIGMTDGVGYAWYYRICFWDHIHEGFTNKYDTVLCFQCNKDGSFPDAAR